MRAGQKAVIGVVGSIAGLIGFLHVYLPFYSDLGQDAQARAGMSTEGSRRTASMWKNMDQYKKAQHQQHGDKHDEE
ncbi:hypothetical protein P43SY_007802 [Pythium insidiosum]|uniref:Uncharacterized protein n=1 Tax=Pythium insidiosum TaxID=114742 RepID=A0AAD5M2B6_PYTIN|nr:hypothetical protein P43SY_007802 [Pythium insidiosum]KAJ0406777.1 hypothetical protein ATCC90586_009426 [Pythium insidiosum]